MRNVDHSNLHSLFIISVVKSRIVTWAGHTARMAEWGSAYKVLDGKPERKRPFGRSGRRSKKKILKWAL